MRTNIIKGLLQMISERVKYNHKTEIMIATPRVRHELKKVSLETNQITVGKFPGHLLPKDIDWDDGMYK